MTTQIALLRAINVGGRRGVAMTDLRALFTELGFSDVATLLQTGNVVFGSTKPAAAVERLLERAAAKRLGLETDFMVRTAAQWRAIVARNPFPEQARKDPARLVLMVCKEAPGKALTITGANREIVRASGREIFIVYPDGQGRSRLKLGARGTARNWNTVMKLATLSSEL